MGSPRVREEPLRFFLCNVFRIGDRGLEKRFENFATKIPFGMNFAIWRAVGGMSLAAPGGSLGFFRKTSSSSRTPRTSPARKTQ